MSRSLILMGPTSPRLLLHGVLLMMTSGPPLVPTSSKLWTWTADASLGVLLADASRRLGIMFDRVPAIVDIRDRDSILVLIIAVELAHVDPPVALNVMITILLKSPVVDNRATRTGADAIVIARGNTLIHDMASLSAFLGIMNEN